MSTAKVVMAALAVMAFHSFGVPVDSAPAQGCDTALKVGSRVVRKEEDWESGEIFGGADSKGVIKYLSPRGVVMVEWENGESGFFKLGYNGKFEVTIHCEGTSPTVHDNATAVQVIQSELSTLPKWNHYLPVDIDSNNDGELSEEEVGEKVKSYMREVFNQLDKDNNQVVIQDEVRKASLDMEFINKVVDIAFQFYPIKTYLGHADRNQDGFISEEDFYLSENNEKMDLEDAHEHCDGECEYDYDYDYNDEQGWTLSVSIPVYKNGSYDKNPLCAGSMGEKEADVFCRELGYKGVESLSTVSFDEYKENNYYSYFDPYASKLICEGSESKLDECPYTVRNNKEYWGVCPFGNNSLTSVTCIPSNTEMGPIHLAGGKVASMGQLHIGDEVYVGAVDINMANVVCRELGFNQGTPKLMEDLNVFNAYIPKFEEDIKCNGSETKLGDCRQSPGSGRSYYMGYSGINCNLGEDLDEKYGRIDHNSFETFWETYGRHLFIADWNGDDKVSVEELKDKAKAILDAVFHLLDQTNDGSFSVEDILTLRLRHWDVIDVVDLLFQVVTGGKGAFNPIDLIPHGVYEIYANKDGRYTWKELSQHIDSSQAEGLLGLLAKYLDTNQDGLIRHSELDNFITMMFNNLDVDASSTITLTDIFKFMKKSQFTCLQIEGVRTFVERWIELIGTQTEKLLDYFFNYLDLDSNQEISLDEFYNLPICNQRDPNDPRACRDILGEFFFSVKTPVVPAMKYMARGPPSQRQSNVVQEKIANSFCIAMHPAY